MPRAIQTQTTVLPTKTITKRKPLWDGPESNTPNGGITFSALSRFLSCRERFRIAMIEGLRPTEKFSHRMEYGQMWHACEEALAANKDWHTALKQYVGELAKRYRQDQEQINHWYNVCRFQFPHYVEYWKKHPDVTRRTPLMQEYVFNVPYRLPSGRTVFLRGKFDSVDLIGTGKTAGVWLQENKTKSDIDEMEIKRQVTYDLQTMLYLTALEWMKKNYGPYTSRGGKGPMNSLAENPIKGVRYNVVRRPLSGGKGSIKRSEGTKGSKCGKCKGEGKVADKKKGNVVSICPKCAGKCFLGGKSEETWEAFYKRAEQYVIDEPETYFMRWSIEITPKDIERFKNETLNPILEQLCCWYSYIVFNHEMGYNPNQERRSGDVVGMAAHFRHPFGCTNTIDEYGWTEVDSYLATGSQVGLRRVDSLFGELK